MWHKNEKKPIVAFLLWTFAISWGTELFIILLERLVLFSLPETIRAVITLVLIGFGAGLAPAYATAILLKKQGYIRSFKDFYRRIFENENASKSVICCLIFGGIFVVSNLLSNSWLGNPWYLAVAVIPLMIFGGGLEEIGWRGTLQPALEEKLGFIPATVLVGIIWAVWHYPLWLVQGANQSAMNILTFTCSCVAMAFLLSALYKQTKSVFACIMVHAWNNALGAVFSLNNMTDPLNTKIILIYVVQICLSIIIFYTADKNKTKHNQSKLSSFQKQ